MEWVWVALSAAAVVGLWKVADALERIADRYAELTEPQAAALLEDELRADER